MTELLGCGPAAEAAPSLVAVGLGANLGDRGEALREAVHAMHQLAHTQVVQVSSLYSSAPVDASGPDYLNAVALLRTALAPQALLACLQAMELAAGRERPYRNAPRTLDLDIVLWQGRTVHTPTLTVPHPRWQERAFVLRPLAELWPEQVSTAHLQAVAEQRIDVAQGPEWVGTLAPA